MKSAFGARASIRLAPRGERQREIVRHEVNGLVEDGVEEIGVAQVGIPSVARREPAPTWRCCARGPPRAGRSCVRSVFSVGAGEATPQVAVSQLAAREIAVRQIGERLRLRAVARGSRISGGRRRNNQQQEQQTGAECGSGWHGDPSETEDTADCMPHAVRHTAADS